MPATSTGVAGTAIVAQCSVPAAGEFVTGAGLKAAFDPTNDDLATIRAGYTPIVGANDATIPAGHSLILTDETSLIKLGASGFSRTRVLDGRFIFDPTLYAEGRAGEIVGLTATITLAAAMAPDVAYYTAAGLPHFATITEVSLWLKGATIGRAFLPTNKPAIDIKIKNIETNVLGASIGSQGDGSASVGAYEAIHAITITGLSTAIDGRKERLSIQVDGEYGTGSVIGVEFVGFQVVYTQTFLET